MDSSLAGIHARPPTTQAPAVPTRLVGMFGTAPMPHRHPEESLWTEQAVDALHVTSDLMTNLAPSGPLAAGFGAGAGLAAVTALLTAPHDLKSDQWQNRLKGVGTLAMGLDSGVTSLTLLNGGALGPAMQGLGRAFGITHGVVDLAEGIIQMRGARKDQSPSRMAQGLFSVGMGAGCIASALASSSPPVAAVLGTGVLACLVGKEIAMHWGRDPQPQAA